MPRMTPSWAEQGTPKASSSVTRIRSLRVSMMRAVRVAMVSQPRPRINGRTALRDIARRAAEELGYEYPHALELSRSLFLRLVELGLCVPSEPV